MKKIAIIGSRSFNDYDFLKNKLKELTITGSDMVVSGGARGADSLAERYAKENGLKTIVHLPNWDEYGKSAGFIRNKLIIDDADIVVAFWDGKSRGTKHSIDLAEKNNKSTFIFLIE